MVEALIDLNKENTLVQTGLQGGSVKLNLGHSRMRAIYWRQDAQGDWVQTNPLPADPMSINLYFAKGFRGKPPVKKESVVEQESLVEAVSEVKYRKRKKSKTVRKQ